MRQASRKIRRFAPATVALAALFVGTAFAAQPASAQRPGGFSSSGGHGTSSFGGGHSSGGSFGGSRSFSSGGFGSGRSFSSGGSFGRSFGGSPFGGGRSFSNGSSFGRGFGGGSFGRSSGASNFGGRSFGGFSGRSGSSFSGRSVGNSPFQSGRGGFNQASRPTFSNGRGFGTGRTFRGATPFPDGHSFSNRFGGGNFPTGRIPVYTANGTGFIGRGSFPYPGFGRPVFDGPGYGPGFRRPVFLGGYYYPNYVSVAYGSGCYPSVFGLYLGFPHFIFGASLFFGDPYVPYYVTPYIPFSCAAPTTVVNNYYSGDADGPSIPSLGSSQPDYPADSYQAAFADIQRGWSDGNIALIRKHLRDSDTKISVFVDRKYSYTIAGSDFTQITRDALDRLDTASFQFTRLRRAQNGDVTAYATHVYRSGNAPATDSESDVTAPATLDNTQPMDQSSAPTQSYDSQSASNPADDPSAAPAPANGSLNTVYVSYTLRKDRETGLWFIVAVDSSTQPLVDNTSSDAI